MKVETAKRVRTVVYRIRQWRWMLSMVLCSGSVLLGCSNSSQDVAFESPGDSTTALDTAAGVSGTNGAPSTGNETGEDLPAIPGMGNDGGDLDDCDIDSVVLEPEEFAAIPHVWFHGVVTDVYAVTDVGSTYTHRSQLGYEGDLLLPLGQCRFVRPRYRLQIDVLDFHGEEIPRSVDVAVGQDWLVSRPTWDGDGANGHDGFTWEGDRFAVGQHIGGNLAWSSRFGLGVVQVNPSTPLFTVGADDTITFQEIDRNVGDFEEYCYAFDSRAVVSELNGMSSKELMDRMAELREGEDAPSAERLEEVRRLGFNRIDWVNDDSATMSFFPSCTPLDYEHDAAR